MDRLILETKIFNVIVKRYKQKNKLCNVKFELTISLWTHDFF